MEVSDQNNAAAFVSDVTIPDGTVMSPGQRFTKTWRLRNSGTSTWRGTSLVFVSGAQMGAPDAVSVPTTAPGETVDISVPMNAPTETGAYQDVWQMRTADGKFFWQGVSVEILVKPEMPPLVEQGGGCAQFSTSVRREENRSSRVCILMEGSWDPWFEAPSVSAGMQ
jgi:hypothetical protein